jgi:hypothetical protein
MKIRCTLCSGLLVLAVAGGGMAVRGQDAGPVRGWRPAGDRIMTRWGEALDPESVWEAYPRPQFRREEWMNLNGLWEYAIQAKSDPGPVDYQGSILVPFCVESALSGVGKPFLPHERLWYRRVFTLPGEWHRKQVHINFEAVDWSATVWINGALVGSHRGGYDRFGFDISPYLKKEGPQEIVVAVDDPSSSGEQPRGKQQLQQHGIWYTPVSGIWQTVWLEAVSPEAHLEEVKITPDVDGHRVILTPMLNEAKRGEYMVRVSIRSEGDEIAMLTLRAEREHVVPLENPRLWSPEDPFLYDIEMVLVNPEGREIDRVSSYFGMRKISLGDSNGNKVLCLNNRPLFHYGTLDQGWWPDGLHTPPSDEAMRYDLEVTKSMGFNMIRKHIKVEPARWYYHCDRLGIMVWQDMPSVMVVHPAGEDTQEETSLFVGRRQEDPPRRTEETAQFEWELRRMIDLHYNAPSIVIWVPFNEGWGQYATCRITDMIKSYDPTRLVNPASGWSLRPCGDIYDIHSYSTRVDIPPVAVDRASVVGEYGGIGLPVEGHLWNPEMRNWGYQTYSTREELLEHYRLKFDQIVAMKKSMGLSAAVYTQTTDVEGEVNGLMTYDRKVIKMPVDLLKEMHSVLYGQ